MIKDLFPAASPYTRLLALGALIVLGYALAGQAATLLEVGPYVSAVYLPAGITVAVAMMLGAWSLPVIFLAVASMPIFLYGKPFAGFGYFDVLRETFVFGITGLALRSLWLTQHPLQSVRRVVVFIIVAVIASLTSTAVLRYGGLGAFLTDGNSYLAFAGGEFAGVLLGTATVVMLREILLRWRKQGTLPWDARFGVRLGVFGVVTVAIALTSAWLPIALGSETEMLAMLVLVPIVLAGLTSGTLLSLVLVGIGVITFLLADGHWNPQPISTLKTQLMFSVSTAVAMLAGAAHDERHYAWELANVDALTGLPNRRLFFDRLEQACLRAARAKSRVAVLFVDLDRFKEVNDNFGHEVGDQLLIEVGHRLKRGVRASDTVARLGGDELVAVLPDIGSDVAVQRVADKIREALRRPFDLMSAREPVHISASVGVACYPDDARDLESLTRCADAAMYEAKIQRRQPLAMAAEHS